ncbi:hypothetical protein WA026_012118 [Henosepilachna vigintioctopunctata]|uniref:Intraflagellar transport protein 57 homolog n=1 Tax=Henosepilachna vigintioctopunctata TaxID=420089 RepID=A0AAW1VBC8_9CUCU
MLRTEPRILVEKEDEDNYTNSFVHHAIMEDLLDKLKLLNYEKDFLANLKMKPIHRYYFIIQKNPGEQFYLFSLLASWLIGEAGQKIEQPQESHDPNDTIENILDCAKANGIKADFTPNKYKQGVGDQVVFLLDQLATLALKTSNHKWKTPILPEEKEEDIEVIDDESEINLERVEEEMIAAYSDDSEEENLFHIGDINRNEKNVITRQTNLNTDEENWNLEVERVVPRLKVTIRNDNRDWRSHLDQMKQYKNNIDQIMPLANTQLKKLHKDITLTLDKIGNREKYLNRELDSVLDDYRQYSDKLSKVKEDYKKISGGVAERNRELNKLNDQLETIKQQMEERGTSMTDGTPLVNIKKAVIKIKQEIVDMDVRIGVLECILLQSRIRDEKQVASEFSAMSLF